MAYDLKITGGTIVDGTGKPGYRGDVGIQGGKIVALGAVHGEAKSTIDATGRIVAPGFVDIHTHYDAQVMWDRMMSISPWHGVTTVVMGNCGFGIAPTRANQHDMIIRTLEKVEGMSVPALEKGLGEDWGFETFPQYLDMLERRGTGINVGVLLGHTPLRLFAMGVEAMERAARPDEVEAMHKLVREAIDAGAIGLATSTNFFHVGFAGKPVPSRLADETELRSLAGALAEAGKGLLQVAAGDKPLSELAAISRSLDITVCWSALLTGRVRNGISYRDQLRESLDYLHQSYRLYPQVTQRPLMTELQMKAPFPLENLPAFARVSAADHEGRKALYADPAFRRAFRESVKGAKQELRDTLSLTVVSECATSPQVQERLIVDLARERGVDLLDVMLDLSLENDLQTRFRMPFFNYREAEVEEVLLPELVLGLSDAGAHADQLCDACQGTDLLGRWVREKKKLSMETAIYMLTSRTAGVFGITDRGRLEVGLAGDVVVFDPDTIGAGPLRRVRDFPGDADRLVADAFGIDAVIVNGTILRRNGAIAVNPDGPLPGKLLRNGRAN